MLVLSGMEGAPLAAEAVPSDAVWDALVAAGLTPEPYAEPAAPRMRSCRSRSWQSG